METTGPRGHKKKQKKALRMGFIGVASTIALAAVIFVIVFAIKNAPPNHTVVNTDTAPSFTQTETNITETEPVDDTVKEVSKASFTVTGDMLIHLSVLWAAEKWTEDEIPNFEPFLSYVSPYIEKADYSVVNLEVTLTDGECTGYPRFKSPDSVATALKNAGFDMATTANNHCYDANLEGLKRTLQIVSNTGMNTLGTVYSKEADNFLIKEVNDISVGMMAYTFETGDNYPDRPSINGLLTSTESVGHISSFDYNQLEKFYAEVSDSMAEMQKPGAEATVIFIHWGNEYQLSPASSQTKIAQKLCDLGVDVIVGGHPHVIQPMDLLESTVDPEHKTVCLYSTGNFLSNQRRNLMGLKTGHTEDGILFSFSFTKYSDGTVALEEAQVLPTWINLHKIDGKNTYDILPLDKSVEDWKSAYSLSDAELNHAKESYDRTMALVGEGLTEIQTYLAEEKSARLEAFQTK